MATVPVVLNGTFTSENGSVMGVFNGTMTTGDNVKPPEPPLGIWPGPGDPDFPGDGKPPRPPVSIWPKPGDPDFPGGGQPPIDPPVEPPYPGHPQWVWGWVIPLQKWMPVYVPGPGEAGPKA